MEELLRVEVRDVNDAPVIAMDQVLIVDEFGAVLRTGAGTQYNTFSPDPEVQDEDSGIWQVSLTYSLATSGNITTATGMTAGPLTDGSSNLFAIDSATGKITVENKPTPRDWSNSGEFRPFLSDVVAGGALVRAVYHAHLSVTDGNLTDTKPVALVVRANLTDTPIIDSFTCEQLPVIATQAVDCNFTGQYLGSVSSTYTVHFNRTDPATGMEQKVEM